MVPAPCQAAGASRFWLAEAASQGAALWRLQDPAARPAQLLLLEELSALVQSTARDYLLVRSSRMSSEVDALGSDFGLEHLSGVAVRDKLYYLDR